MRTRPCEKGCGRQTRKRRGARFCSPCVAKLPKKTCSSCSGAFAPDMMTGTRCRPCASSTAWERRIKVTYGITAEDYFAILARQGGGCGVCGRKLVRKRYSVDHDHSCCAGPTSCGNCVRGLLCSACNTFIGYCHDDPDAGTRMATYLTTPPAMQIGV